MAGICVEKLPHSCGTRQGLQVYADPDTGSVNGYCHSCEQYIKNPYGDEKTIGDIELPKPKSQEEIDLEIQEVNLLPVVDLPTRKLREIDLKEFNIKVGLSEQDGKTPSIMYSPITKDGELKGYIVKTLQKPYSIWSIGDTKDGDFFNWENAIRSGSPRLIITEGIEDAVAVSSIHRRYGNEEYKPAIVSLPRGAGSAERCIAKNLERLKQFKRITLCYDGDKAGQKAIEKSLLLLPNALVAKLPEKDANECIIKGCSKAAYNALEFNASTPNNSRIINGSSLAEIAREPTPWGELIWPFPKLQESMRGIRYGETIYIGAGVKMGKSDLLDEIASSLIKNHNINILLVKPEEETKKTWKKICGKMVDRNFVDPKIEFNYDKYDEAVKLLGDRVDMLDLYQHLSWETLKSDIVYSANKGVKAVFIDPITNLTNGMETGRANEMLQKIAQDLAALAKDLNIVIFVFCHLKANDGHISKDIRNRRYEKGEYISLGNCPHEVGGDISSAQFAGSRAMMRSCNLMLGLEGNKDPNLPDEIQRKRWLTVLEDREFGNSLKVPLIWNRDTTRYTGI